MNSITDFEQILKLLEPQKRTQKPQMILGVNLIQAAFDMYGREGLIGILNLYSVTTTIEGAELVDKLLKPE